MTNRARELRTMRSRIRRTLKYRDGERNKVIYGRKKLNSNNYSIKKRRAARNKARRDGDGQQLGEAGKTPIPPDVTKEQDTND